MKKIVLMLWVMAGLPLTAMAASIEMKVNGLVCAFCAQGIEKQLKKLPATAEVFVSLENQLVAVQLHEGQSVSDEVLRKLLEDAGYTLVSTQRTDETLEALRQRVVPRE